MRQATRAQLLALNRRFYREHADAFGATRGRAWPGFARVIGQLAGTGRPRVLDLGCGNGRFGAALAERLDRDVEYLGLDQSAELLEAARERDLGSSLRFEPCDILDANALAAGADQGAGYDLIGLFGVLHHVPGAVQREGLLRAAAALLAPSGLLALTFWGYDRDPRFASRRVDPGELVPPIDVADLDTGDAILRFGNAPGALRYCHFPDAREREALLARLPLRVRLRFESDGAEQRLNEYVLLQRD